MCERKRYTSELRSLSHYQLDINHQHHRSPTPKKTAQLKIQDYELILGSTA